MKLLCLQRLSQKSDSTAVNAFLNWDILKPDLIELSLSGLVFFNVASKGKLLLIFSLSSLKKIAKPKEKGCRRYHAVITYNEPFVKGKLLSQIKTAFSNVLVKEVTF